LVNVNHFVNELDALDGRVLAGAFFGAVHELSQPLVENLHH
jgi:hypothetical protein